MYEIFIENDVIFTFSVRVKADYLLLVRVRP